MQHQQNIIDEIEAEKHMQADSKAWLATLPEDVRAEMEARDRELSDEGEGDDDDQT